MQADRVRFYSLPWREITSDGMGSLWSKKWLLDTAVLTLTYYTLWNTPFQFHVPVDIRRNRLLCKHSYFMNSATRRRVPSGVCATYTCRSESKWKMDGDLRVEWLLGVKREGPDGSRLHSRCTRFWLIWRYDACFFPSWASISTGKTKRGHVYGWKKSDQ